MAKYFIDTEFIEGFHKPLFGKKRHFIDLISIGIICEDGRTYYAVSNEFNPKDADKWVKDNVISKLPERVNLIDPSVSPRLKHEALAWRSNTQIKKDLLEFFGYAYQEDDFGSSCLCASDHDIQIYAYYADYDWVVFCSIFGRMIDLPFEMPMYCRDIKQMFDEAANKKDWHYGRDIWANRKGELQEKDRPATLREKIEKLKSHHDYPCQKDEHNALDDARWNMRLHKFITNFY